MFVSFVLRGQTWLEYKGGLRRATLGFFVSETPLFHTQRQFSASETESLMDNYKVIRELGSGNYGTAYLVEHVVTGVTYVCKKVDLSTKPEHKKQESYNEVRTMSKLDHPNIVGFVEAFTDKEVLHIVMEYADNNDLEKLILDSQKNNRPIPQETIMDYFVQIALGLRQLHKQHFLHRDLKPANVFLLTNGTVKIGDFGFSKQLNYTMALASTICGTPYYFAPELCQKLPYNNKVDVWSLGVILYEMINLKKPFEAKSFGELRKKVVGEEPDRMTGSHVADDIKQLCLALLRKSSSSRPTVEMVLQAPCVKAHLSKFQATLDAHSERARAALAQIAEQHPRKPGEVRNVASTAAAPPVMAPAAMKGGRFSKEEMKALLAGGGGAAQPAPAAAPVERIFQRTTADVRDTISMNAPEAVMKTAAMELETKNACDALKTEVTAILSEPDDDLGDPQSDEEREVRRVLGEDRFLEALKITLCAVNPNEKEEVRRQRFAELDTFLGPGNGHLKPLLVKVSEVFEIDTS